MLDFIVFAENKYPIRKIAIEGYESALMISTEDLEAVLINEDGGYTSPEARLRDEQIFFYVSKRIAVDCSDEEVVEVLQGRSDFPLNEEGVR
ncbi:MAG: hypothetical protein IKF90_25830 [Parasporobacterium sp.]|nr:hypothetical protein [Parasporobacterium sp.]